MNIFNQCVSGDTKVLTVDGAISFKELSERNEDVDVYCLNEFGEVIISKMFNPRKTGYKQPVYKITLENGVVLTASCNHKFLTPDGYKRVDELYEDDAITIVYPNYCFDNDYIHLNHSDEINSLTKYIKCEGTKKGTVIKTCEYCGKEFEIEWDCREVCVCNEHNNCYVYYMNTIEGIEKYTNSWRYLRIDKMEFISKGIDVYNGTVAVYHNYFTYDESTKTMINQLNCGEVSIYNKP